MIDDAQSQIEAETLIAMSAMEPKQVVMIGCAEGMMPRPLVHAVENAEITQYSKSMMVRMVEREYH